ncbi:hypothetical protein NE237_010655 [Protea cynaroides]|uniref:Uncharacterized protein n=1 Tax=Protea cynaroides TaxID=273540 RepID=A0A9Q0R1W2_9MAGN|nr:hypothetical protein NE237_010655 [Protea cynaroides]
MAEPSNNPPLSNPITIVGPRFCAPCPVNLTIITKDISIGKGNFSVKDVDGNIVFEVDGTLSNIRDRRVLLDANGEPLLFMRSKIMTAHERWNVYRGESSDSKELLFSVKKSSMFQLIKTKMNVFLATNTTEEVCDFKIKGNWSDKSCKIYLRKSNDIIAEMHKKHKWFGEDSLTVTVYPNIDSAFIVALIVILNDIEEDKRKMRMQGMASVNLGSIVVGSSAGNHVDGPWRSVMTRPTGPLNQNLAVNQTVQGGVFPLEAMNNGSDNVTDVLQMVGDGSQPEKISRCAAADVGVRRNISPPMERVDLGKFLGFLNLDDLVSKIDDVEILEDRVDQLRLHRRKRTRWMAREKGKNSAMSAVDRGVKIKFQ